MEYLLQFPVRVEKCVRASNFANVFSETSVYEIMKKSRIAKYVETQNGLLISVAYDVEKKEWRDVQGEETSPCPGEDW